MIPEGREDDHEDVTRIPLASSDPDNTDELIKLNDSVPMKVKDIGEFTFKVIDESKNEVYVLTTKNTLRLGASYEYLLQYDETDESNTQNISVISRKNLVYLKFCKINYIYS